MRRGAACAGGGGLKNLTNWRSVRLWESRVEQQLRQRHAFWLHGLCIGLVTLGLTWKPLLGAVVCAVLLGVAIDYFVPAANSLPQAIQLLSRPAR